MSSGSDRAGRRRPRALREAPLAGALATAYFLLVAYLAVRRHESFHSAGFDLGIFDQVFWNTIHGRPFESSMSQGRADLHSFLSDHFSPLLWVLVPFYRAFPHPETLVVAQAALMAVGAWPLYVLARSSLGSGYGLFITGVYFLYPPVTYITFEDFHEVALVVPLLGFALALLVRAHRGWFLACLGLTFLVNEQMPLIGLGFGTYLLLGRRDWKLGAAVLLSSLATFFLILQVVIPALGGGHSYPYVRDRYAALGGSPGGIMLSLFTRPLLVAKVVVQLQKVKYLVAILGPVLGLPIIAGWAALVSVPVFGYLLLSNYKPQYSFTEHYVAPLIPLVLGTAVLGLARLPATWRPALATAMMASSLAFSYLFGILPFERRFELNTFLTPARYVSFQSELARIGPQDSVAADDTLVSHLSERRYIYDLLFDGVSGAKWVVLDDPSLHDVAYRARVVTVEDEGYRLVATRDRLALFEKRGATR